MEITAKSITNYQVEINAGAHRWISDETESEGGEDSGPNPYALFLGALAACKIITVQMYAQRKGWPVEDIRIRLKNSKVDVRDCEDCDQSKSGKVDIIDGDVTFYGDLTEEQLARLYEISNRCPVHRSLTSETKIQVALTQVALEK